MLGVPAPLAVYGYLPADAGAASGTSEGGGGLDFLGGLALSLEAPLEGDPALRFGLWAEGSWIRGSEQDTSADIYLAAGGCALAWLTAVGAGRLRLSVGPGVFAGGVVVDAAMRLDTWALGGRADASLDWRVGEGLAIGPWASVLMAAPPLDEDAWFNKPLGGTRVLQVGVTLSLGAVPGAAR